MGTYTEDAAPHPGKDLIACRRTSFRAMWKEQLAEGDMERLVDNERIFVARRCGTGSGASVVAFGGVQLGFGGIAHIEFARSLRRPAVSHDAYFVLEKRGSFYNDVHEEVVGVLRPLLSRNDVYLLGNSMGGFGALTLDGAFPQVRATIAFAPQYNVAPGGPVDERRFRDYINYETDWRHGCVPMSRGARRFVFFGEHDVDDQAHASAFARSGDPYTRVYTILQCGHDVARYLRDTGLLHTVLDAIINEGATHDDIAALIEPNLTR